MDKLLKLCEEEVIFSGENFIQNVKWLQEDFDEDLRPRKYMFDIDGKKITVIFLHRTTVTRLMGTFKNHTFRLMFNEDDRVILASPTFGSGDLFTNDLMMESYGLKLATHLSGASGEFSDRGSKIGTSVKNFLLWNFYNYKLFLNV